METGKPNWKDISLDRYLMMGIRRVLIMAKYINQEVAIAKLTALEVAEPNATMVDAKRVLADMSTIDINEEDK